MAASSSPHKAPEVAPTVSRPADSEWDQGRVVSIDRAHVWHPYGPMPAAVDALPIARAEGVWLEAMDGTRLIDGMSSWWAACHGHRHPHLMEAAHRQLDTLPHVMFGGLTHQPAVEAAMSLVDLTDDGLDHVFFCDSGSVSVEVAIKMALQYWRGHGQPQRTKLLTWRRGYHGDTQGAMSVCDPDGGMHSLWAGTLTPQIFVDPPCPRGSSEQDIRAYVATIAGRITDEVAAIIIEPRVQGAGGMRLHDDELLRQLRALCDETGVLLIADEIATAFGRTGDIFATQAASVTPDILCVGKALTGGVMSFAATITTPRVAEAVSSPQGGGALMHGPTFMGNPLAAAVATASLDLIRDGYWRSTVPAIESQLTAGLEDLLEHPAVADVRVLGAIGVVEMNSPIDMASATRTCIETGVWLRPFGRLLYTMPPFISTPDDIAAICSTMHAVVARHGQEG